MTAAAPSLRSYDARVHATSRTLARDTSVVLAVAGALLVQVVVVTGYMALQDFGEWNYQGYVLGRALRGESLGVATLKDYPVPYTLSNALLGGLGAILPPLYAGVVAIFVQVLAGSVAVAWVIRARELDWRVALPVLATLVVLGSGFWNGYAAHQLGLAVFTGWLALPREHRTRPLLVLVFSLLLFFSHALVFFSYAVAVGILALADRRVLRVALAALPSVALILWYAVHSPPEPAGGGVSMTSPVSWVAYKGYTFAKSGSYQNLIVNAVGDDRPLMFVGAAINVLMVGLVLLLAANLVLSVRLADWRRHADLVAGTVLVLVGLALPAFFLGIVNPGERLFGPGLILLATAALEARVWPRLRATAAGAACAGLLLTGVSSVTLSAKADRGDPVPQGTEKSLDESPGSRVDVLLGHRLDQMETRFDAADRAWHDDAEPTVPLIFDEGLLLPRER